MRRFQNILYITRGTEDETASLKQALSLARNNATQLHTLVISPMLPKISESTQQAMRHPLPIASERPSRTLRLR